MNLDKLVAITGKSGIFKMLTNKTNGMIAENLDTRKKGFFSTRSYQFTPLESISIYTTDEEGGATLKKVFTNMLAGGDIPETKAAADDLRAYFAEVLPEHDQDQVHISDIKKIIKWFKFLNERDLLSGEEEEAEEVAAEGKVEEVEEVKADEKE